MRCIFGKDWNDAFLCNYACVLNSKYPESGEGGGRGGLAARSGTDFTWSPQLRNLAKWERVPTSLQDKYGGEYIHGRKMSFCSVLSFPTFKHQEKVFMNFFNRICGHEEAWCMNSSWVTSIIVIWHRGKFSYFLASWIFERTACSISYIFPLTVVLRLSSLS